MKKEITKQEYLQIVGLMMLARQAAKQILDCEKAYGSLLEMVDKDTDNYFGHFSDEIWGEGNVDAVLTKEGVKVKK